MPFSQLLAPIGEALASQGYETPTAVQAAVLEPEAAGRDLIVSAQTGSGKTVAFGLAIAPDLLDEEGRFGPPREPLALVVAPTRELALQVSRELTWLFGKAHGRIATCVGGMDVRGERRVLQQGAHIVVGTPGRLRDHLERGSLVIGNVRAVILDEADEMLDMGFREELEEILEATPSNRRTLMFSATMPRPIVALAKRYQRDALRISTVGEDRGHGDISYQAMAVAPADIENAVVNLLRFHEAESAMLFCATRDNVRRVHASLTERGFDAVALSGEHSQNERNRALQALRDGKARVCVATDVAARGIDLPSLSLVVHVEIPRDAETLQHRSGRTGRAGKKGTAVLIVPYPRRKRVEGMLRGAKINAEWTKPPSLDDIRARDAERMFDALMAPVDPTEEEKALAVRLMAERTPEQIAAALIQMHRSKMPSAEDMLDDGSRPARGEARVDGPRPGFEETIWFSMNVGRNQNADPRWLLPLLCRRGHITKTEIGAIRITANETMFEVRSETAGRFSDALTRTERDDPDGDGGVEIRQVAGKPREEAKQRRGGPNQGRPDAPHREAVRPTLSRAQRSFEGKPSGKADGRPSGQPGGRPGGRPGGKPGGRPGGKPTFRRTTER
jgi:ATP-dependent RNA helicase DeaD